jgi:rhodanese-related sulfurtransferase
MNVIKKILITFLMSFSLFGLLAQSKHDFKSVSVEEFEKALADTSYVVLDVRMPVEYAEGHIPGTDFNIDVLEDSFKSEALKKLPKDRPVALYCRSGNRSKTAARILSENGYEVLELATGYLGWSDAGKPVETEIKK